MFSDVPQPHTRPFYVETQKREEKEPGNFSGSIKGLVSMVNGWTR